MNDFLQLMQEHFIREFLSRFADLVSQVIALLNIGLSKATDFLSFVVNHTLSLFSNFLCFFHYLIVLLNLILLYYAHWLQLKSFSESNCLLN